MDSSFQDSSFDRRKCKNREFCEEKSCSIKQDHILKNSIRFGRPLTKTTGLEIKKTDRYMENFTFP